MDGKRILLTGATGFVGRYLYPALTERGVPIRCVSRDPDRARSRWPDREWVGADLANYDEVRAAMEGCAAAYYLVHGMSEGHHDFRRREVQAAETFSAAAADAGVERIIYLGGLRPANEPTQHLLSRLEVGETLRAGRVPTLELRASMIVGHGSLSWIIVRDLAARLPVMILPRWLNSRTQPVAIDDVTVALIRGLDIPLPTGIDYDLPGADTLSAREIIEAIAEVMGFPRPPSIQVPVLSPYLSSRWVRFVTRADWTVAREVVIGLTADFLARDARYWELIGHQPLGFREAARRALAAEINERPTEGFWGAIEAWRFRRLARRCPA